MDHIWANFWYGFRWGTGKLNSSPKEPPSAIVGSQGGPSMAPPFTIFQNIKVICNHRQVFLPTVKRQLLNEVNMFLLGHLQIWAHQHTRASPQKSVNCAQLASLKSDFLWLSCPIWLPGSWSESQKPRQRVSNADRKVFATSSLLAEEFPDILENVRILYKISRWYAKCPDELESFHMM